MGGQLPTIHSHEDMKYLLDTVFIYNSAELSHYWIGLKKTNGSRSTYMDGTPVDYKFTIWDNMNCSHSDCRYDNCAFQI